ncbi:hypothetical protein ACOSP7_009614 [Xanthoceras sorbifolium]
MGKRHVIVVLWLLLVLIFLVSNCQGARFSSRDFKVRKPIKSNQNSSSSSPRTVVGFLPKTMPIPPSAPSKAHNDIGLQSPNNSSWP